MLNWLYWSDWLIIHILESVSWYFVSFMSNRFLSLGRRPSLLCAVTMVTDMCSCVYRVWCRAGHRFTSALQSSVYTGQNQIHAEELVLRNSRCQQNSLVCVRVTSNVLLLLQKHRATVGSTFHLLQTSLSDWTQTASALVLLHWSIQTRGKASINQRSINKLLQ